MGGLGARRRATRSGGFGVGAGVLGWASPRLTTAATMASVRLRSSYALTLGSCGWMGAETLNVSGTLNASESCSPVPPSEQSQYFGSQ